MKTLYTVVISDVGFGPASSLISAIDMALEISDEGFAVSVLEGSTGVERKIAEFRGGMRIYPAVVEFQAKPADSAPDIRRMMASLESGVIDRAMERANGNKMQAAKILGLPRTTLVSKLKARAQASSAS